MITPKFLPLGDTALLVEFGDIVDKALSDAVIALDRRLAVSEVTGLLETAPSFRSLMIGFDPLVTDHAAIEAAVRPMIEAKREIGEAGRRWQIPVCYQDAYGPDMSELSQKFDLTADQIIELHLSVTHFVYMIGFLPGHPYLGDLPPTLTVPRRQEPRLKVPRGSVAIAVGLTVIYPVESPGGWNIIGRTPVPMFDISNPSPSVMSPGDEVQFIAIEPAEFQEISTAVANGRYQPSWDHL